MSDDRQPSGRSDPRAAAAAEIAFPLFGALWAAHVLSHYWSYASWFVSPLAFLTVCSSLYLLMKPSSPARLAFSALTYCLTWFTHLPITPNHETLAAFVAASFTIALAIEGLWSWKRPFSRARALAVALPIARGLVVVMYFWAAFHKINRDFLFSPAASCGAVFYKAFPDRFPFLPEASGAIHLALAWGTLLIEAAIPVLLLVPRTRYWGIALAWSFHFLLVLNPMSGFYNFTSLLFLLFLMFASETFFERLGEAWRRAIDRPRRLLPEAWWRAAPGLFVGAAALGLSLWLVNRFSIPGLFEELTASATARRVWLRELGFFAFLVWSVPLSLFTWMAWRRTASDPRRMIGGFRRVPKALWLLPLLLFLWGATPYLGLKTENSFAMFSNLRTEVRPNHLLVPGALKLFPYQDDRVKILAVNGKGPGGTRLRARLRARKNYEIPYEGLRGQLRSELRYGAVIDQVKYVRDGQVVVERYAEGAPVLGQGMWAHKLLQFRQYRPEGPMTCEH